MSAQEATRICVPKARQADVGIPYVFHAVKSGLWFTFSLEGIPGEKYVWHVAGCMQLTAEGKYCQNYNKSCKSCNFSWVPLTSIWKPQQTETTVPCYSHITIYYELCIDIANQCKINTATLIIVGLQLYYLPELSL